MVLITFNTKSFSKNYILTSDKSMQGNIYHTGGNLGIGTTSAIQTMLDDYVLTTDFNNSIAAQITETDTRNACKRNECHTSAKSRRTYSVHN